ncbi:hypothetical protein ACQP3F_31040, partial [Escherichia coli]
GPGLFVNVLEESYHDVNVGEDDIKLHHFQSSHFIPLTNKRLILMLISTQFSMSVITNLSEVALSFSFL